MTITKKFNLKRGFTLIELLIVIAILGVLAVVVLLALNPIQQLARTRDAGRKSGVAQLGHAIEANATTNNGVYLTPVATWITSLQTSGEISSIPQVIAYSAPASGTHPIGAPCATVGTVFNQSNYCYTTYGGNTRAIVYSRLESGADNNRCTALQAAWFVYSTTNSSAGILCTTLPAIPGDPGINGYNGAVWIQ